ncbi:hypothetical protein CANCADRAFT_2245 [Tortispora caseinolytica NRRL Y-17796]|uniref:Inositol polyphosphate-related phosphatase domain-containing protein n=1 Tax=Tortispora caseinolytica NRRL Y-17796 TaxID=767744 RepID=A0A1E4TFR8_9ASCO|nr:hypothetical protein CANCADRAFT_2245 [Tortispora caseinolytica NRRL Y-17796]
MDIGIITFNAGKELPDSEQLTDELAKQFSINSPDILAVGLQECTGIRWSFIGDLTYIVESYSTAVNNAAKRINKEYELVFNSNVGPTMLLIFASLNRSVPGSISSIQAGDCGTTGPLQIKVKGAIAVRFLYTFDDSSLDPVLFTFVCAHLAANENEVDSRNYDYECIVKYLRFAPASAQPEDDVIYTKKHQHLFVFGDLNYRCSMPSASQPESMALINSTDLDPYECDFTDQEVINRFLKLDELSLHKDAGRTLHLLKEAPITFPPTYKFVQSPKDGTRTYSLHRIPSWTDRILFLPYIEPEKVIIYTSMPSVKTSDHVPVYLGISVPLGGAIIDSSVTLPRPLTSNEQLPWRIASTYSNRALSWGLYFSTSARGLAVSTIAASALYYLSASAGRI